ncbi:MAG TPA: glycosyltransferase N-terminal domain-containing protein [Syntrophorhabdaceae bacterium]|nr:glycosyltransferase N-terminal domain-containing protein [Syntrophorhabdaceae bacterium]
MWKIVYNVLLHILLPFFLVYSLTNRKIRQNLVERLYPNTNNFSNKGAIWIHAASVGEAVIAETVVNYIRKRFGFSNFVITTNTYYTRDMLRKKYNDTVSVHSLPFDLPFSLNQFIGKSTFKSLIIVETELWPNLIWMAKKRSIPVIIINGRISDKTYSTYQSFSFFLKHMLSDISLVLAQSDLQAKRFKTLGMDSKKIINTGNIKYYREIEYKANRQREKMFITFGSIKERELEVIFDVVDRLKRRFVGYVYVVAPREMNLVNVIESKLSARFNTMRYSLYKRSDMESIKSVETIVVDTVGDLLDIYCKSLIAFVGGSLAPYGGQNILEPLFFETPVLFGPHVENFKDIAETIMKDNAGKMVKDSEELFENISLIVENHVLREEMGRQGQKIIDAQKAVMERTTDIIMGISQKAL